MASKDIQKSVRLSPEIYAYIDNYRGENFSVKLSNLVYDARKGEKQRVARLNDLDKHIDLARDRLKGLQNDYDTFNRVIREVRSIENHFSTILERVDSYMCESDERRPSGKSPPG